MKHPQLLVYSDDRTINYTGANAIDWQYINHGIIKNISQLNKGINSSSSTAEVTLSHDSPYTLPILECEKDLHAVLKEVEDPQNPVVYFTGYISQDFTWTVDSRGAQAVKITLEDVGTKKFKTPYTTGSSALIEGTASECISDICSVAGVIAGASTQNITTPVKTIAEDGETCQELMTTLCEELGYAYYFSNEGVLELKLLSTDTLTNVPTVDDSDLYDTIKLNKQARQYKGSRITYKTLADRSGALVYRDITNQSASHKDCWIELSLNEYYPASSITSIECVDLEEGKEIYTVENVVPTVVWSRGSGTSSIALHGSNSLDVRLQCTNTAGFNKGAVSKLQATADITYIDSTEVIYGEGETSGSKDYFEYDCRWIHTQTPAIKFANFIAQYYQYCSREFTFKSKSRFELGQIIKLHENVFSGLETYLIISTIKETDSTQVITYTANSISAFNYTKQTTNSGTTTPPSTVYVPTADVENTMVNIIVSPTTFYKDLRDTTNASISFEYWYNGTTVAPAAIVWDVVTNDGTHLTVSGSTTTESVTVAKNNNYTYVKVSGYVTGSPETLVEVQVDFIDNTTYNKNWGTLTALPSGVVLNGDYFIAGSTFSGYTLGCPYVYSGNTWTALTASDPENTMRLFNLMGNVMASDLTVPAVSAMYAWFGTLIAQDAAIQNLFSKNITILNNGSIHSAAYDDTGTYIGPGPGFWLGANGQLFCDSGQMKDLVISGNSTFSGSFNCTAIQTAISDPVVAQQVTLPNANDNQAMSLYNLINNNYRDKMQQVEVSFTSPIRYMMADFTSGGSQGRDRYFITFYDELYNQLDLNDYVSMSTNLSNPTDPYRKGLYWYPRRLTWDTEYYSKSNTLFTIYIQIGGNTLIMNIPTSSQGLVTGMLWRDGNDLKII